MGCCGCDNRTSTNTAGIFALVQCIVGLILAIYNLSIFYGDCNVWYSSDSKAYLCFSLINALGSVRGLLVVLTIIYVIWGISSIFLLVGNANNRAGYVQQWVVISTIVIICDVVLPAILMATTYSKIVEQYSKSIYDSNRLYPSLTTEASTQNLASHYLVLLCTFSRGGLITWICDIALTVYASRRAREIQNPPTAFVFPHQVVGGTVYPGGVVQQPQYLQHGFVAQAQYQPQYLPQAQYQSQYQTQAQGGALQTQQHPKSYDQPPPSTNYGDFPAGPPPSYSTTAK